MFYFTSPPFRRPVGNQKQNEKCKNTAVSSRQGRLWQSADRRPESQIKKKKTKRMKEILCVNQNFKDRRCHCNLFASAKLRTIFEGRIALKRPVSNILQLSLFFPVYLCFSLICSPQGTKKAPEPTIPVLTLTDKRPSLISYSISGRFSGYSHPRWAYPSSQAHCTPARHSAAAGSSDRQPVA